MGVDWDAFITIYSENTDDLKCILQNFPTYFKENIVREDNEGRVYVSKHCIEIHFSEHTTGLSTNRLNGLYDIFFDILFDFRECFIKAGWWADSGTMKEFVGWNENSFPKTHFITYETVDDQFYPHFQSMGRDLHYYIKKKNEEYTYKFDLTIESFQEFDSELLDNLFIAFKAKDITYCKGCSNWLDIHFTTDILLFDHLYKVLQEYKGSYIKVDWNTRDGTESGLWVGRNENQNITVQSIRYPTNPNLYTTWGKDKRILVNEHIVKLYKQ
jgi:hypothetical protein